MLPFSIITFGLLLYGIYLIMSDSEDDISRKEETDEEKTDEQKPEQNSEKNSEQNPEQNPEQNSEQNSEQKTEEPQIEEPARYISIDDEIEMLVQNSVRSFVNLWRNTIQPNITKFNKIIIENIVVITTDPQESEAPESEAQEEQPEKPDELNEQETQEIELKDLWSSYRLDQKYEEMKNQHPLDEYLNCDERHELIRNLFKQIYRSEEYRQNPSEYIKKYRSQRPSNEYSVIKDTVLNLLDHIEHSKQ